VGDVASSGLSWKEKGKQRASAADGFLESEVSSLPRPTGAGEVAPELTSADTSGEIRVRGKEQELTAVREERRAREQRWESEVETTMIREEKADYEDKIKQLEEEVQWLKAEVRDFHPVVLDIPFACSLRC